MKRAVAGLLREHLLVLLLALAALALVIALLSVLSSPASGVLAAAAALIVLAALGAAAWRSARALAGAAAQARREGSLLEKKLTDQARLAAIHREVTAIFTTRSGGVADQTVLDFLKSQLGCASVFLGRLGANGSLLAVDTEARSERTLPADGWPRECVEPMRSGRVRIAPGESVVLPLLAGSKPLGVLVLRTRAAGFTAEDLPFFESLQPLLGAAFQSQIQKQEQEYRKLKIIEDAYRLSEAKLRAIFDESQDMILTIDGEGRIIDINRAGARLLGFDSDESAIGRRESEFWSNEKDYIIFMGQITEHGFVKDFETILRRRDGATVFGLESATMFRNRDGSVQEIHAMVKDITERIRDEQSLWKMNIELAEANQKLRESQTRAVQQEKLASIGQLAAGVAHEINNPLAFLKSNNSAVRRNLAAIKQFILSLTGSACAEIEDGRKKYDIDYIVGDFDAIMEESEDGFRRITDIVQNLKNFSRIDSAERFAQFDINKGIENTLSVARNEVKYVAEVKLDLGTLPMVECVGGEINQVFLNLIVNAAQAIKSQERKALGVITIATRGAEDSVTVEIKDDGPGIPKGLQMRIFDPFYTTKPVGQGTGLGLSISSDIIVHKHRGALTVDSAPGAGACFKIELPVKHPPDDASPVPPPQVPLR
jgi:PAS domain S-box-containing protein